MTGTGRHPAEDSTPRPEPFSGPPRSEDQLILMPNDPSKQASLRWPAVLPPCREDRRCDICNCLRSHELKEDHRNITT